MVIEYNFTEAIPPSFSTLRGFRNKHVIRLHLRGKRRALQEFFKFLDTLINVRNSGQRYGVTSTDVAWVPNVFLSFSTLVSSDSVDGIKNYFDIMGAIQNPLLGE